MRTISPTRRISPDSACWWSATDRAAWTSPSRINGVTPQPVLLAIRSDIVIARQYPYGLPNTVWHLISHLLPKRWRKDFLNRVNYQTYNDLADLDLPLAPNRDDRVGTSAPARGRDLIDAVRAGRIVAVKGLARLEGRLRDARRRQPATKSTP